MRIVSLPLLSVVSLLSLLSLLFTLSSLAGTAAALASIRVDPSSGQFIDLHGRVRIFHGVNVVEKLPPFLPRMDACDSQRSLCAADLDALQRWGFNVIRLGVMWRAVEPSRGAYNATFLADARAVVDALEKRGMFAIVDAHQDVLHPDYCGEGFPDFASRAPPGPLGNLTSFPSPLPINLTRDASGVPLPSSCQENAFFLYNFAFDVNGAWGAFYGSDDLRSAFAGAWGAVASAFNTSAAVLAYELLNEPWPGNVYSNPLIALESGRADRESLAPLYAAAHAAIRQADDRHIIMYEPSVHEYYLAQHTGFTSGPGGAAYNDRQAYAYHVYCENQNKTGDPVDVKACNDAEKGVWTIGVQDGAALGAGSFMTEFGAFGPNEASAESIRSLLDLADSNLTSWAYWTYKGYDDVTTQNPATETFFNDDGSLQTLKVRALARSYPQAVAGHPTSIHFSFNADTGALSVAYSYNSASTAPTEVFLSEEFYYANGFTVDAEPSSLISWVPDPSRPYVLLFTHSSAMTDGQAVTINVTPK